MTIQEVLTRNQPPLFAITYRPTGEVAVGEDIVQASPAHRVTHRREDVKSPRSKHLAASKSKRGAFNGTGLPQPIVQPAHRGVGAALVPTGWPLRISALLSVNGESGFNANRGLLDSGLSIQAGRVLFPSISYATPRSCPTTGPTWKPHRNCTVMKCLLFQFGCHSMPPSLVNA